MLEYNHCINTIEDFKDFIIAAYTIIDDIYKEIVPKHIKNRRNKPKSLISDSEIITISIIGELLTIVIISISYWVICTYQRSKD